MGKNYGQYFPDIMLSSGDTMLDGDEGWGIEDPMKLFAISVFNI